MTTLVFGIGSIVVFYYVGLGVSFSAGLRGEVGYKPLVYPLVGGYLATARAPRVPDNRQLRSTGILTSTMQFVGIASIGASVALSLAARRAKRRRVAFVPTAGGLAVAGRF